MRPVSMVDERSRLHGSLTADPFEDLRVEFPDS
jgi:hypothetical protein